MMDDDDLAGYLTVKEFCHRSGIGKTFFYEQVKAGRIRTFKVSYKKTLVPRSELGWLARGESEAA